MSEIIKNFIDTMDHGEVMVTCGSFKTLFSCEKQDFLFMDDDNLCIASGSGDSSRLLNINGKVTVRSVDETLVFTDPSGNTVTISK